MSSPSESPSAQLQLEEFPYLWNAAFEWESPDKYEDLQVLSIWDGTSSCYGRLHLHYNETHLTLVEGMEYHTYTRPIDRGETVRDHSYYALTSHTEASDVLHLLPPPSDDDWNWQPENLVVTGYTLRQSTIVTGEILHEVMLNMEDVHAIADGLTASSNVNSDRQFLRSSAKKTTQDRIHQDYEALTTIHVQTRLEFSFFQGKGSVPSSDDLGSCIAATKEFFRQVFQKRSASFVDFSMSNVVPREDTGKADHFTLEFVSNIVQEGDSLTAREAADVMGSANFKHYIGHFLRLSPSNAFHSTFKVFFRGIAKA